MDASPRPKIAETIIHETVRQREAQIGRRCEILANTRIEYAALGDYSYLGENCEVADAVIGKFTAIANSVRIGAPNHPMGRPSQHRFTYCPEYYEATASRDRDFFADRRSDRVIVGNDVWIGHAAILLPGVTVGDGAVIAAGAVVSRDVEPYTIVGRSRACHPQALSRVCCEKPAPYCLVGLAGRTHLRAPGRFPLRGDRRILQALRPGSQRLKRTYLSQTKMAGREPGHFDSVDHSAQYSGKFRG